MNHQIIYNLQDIFNMLPDITNGKFIDAFHVKTNDQMLVSEHWIVSYHKMLNLPGPT